MRVHPWRLTLPFMNDDPLLVYLVEASAVDQIIHCHSVLSALPRRLSSALFLALP